MCAVPCLASCRHRLQTAASASRQCIACLLVSRISAAAWIVVVQPSHGQVGTGRSSKGRPSAGCRHMLQAAPPQQQQRGGGITLVFPAARRLDSSSRDGTTLQHAASYYRLDYNLLHCGCL